MRAFTAIVILAACSLRSCAHSDDRDVSSISDIPVQKLFNCTRHIGPTKCFSALASYRAENALHFKERLDPDSRRDFPWERYANKSDDELYSGLCDGTERLLQFEALKFNMIPGYEFKLASSGNGTLNVDVFHSSPEAARGMKKMRKVFYNIVPYLLLPGLIMSAILPFVLPALKMMTIAVGMLNNMALSGAIFTLLRNNAFNDKYDKKVIYVNEGYHNEKHAKVHHESEKPEVIDYDGQGSEVYNVAEPMNGDFEFIAENPSTNTDWIKEYYGNKFLKIAKGNVRDVRA